MKFLDNFPYFGHFSYTAYEDILKVFALQIIQDNRYWLSAATTRTVESAKPTSRTRGSYEIDILFRFQALFSSISIIRGRSYRNDECLKLSTLTVPHITKIAQL